MANLKLLYYDKICQFYYDKLREFNGRFAHEMGHHSCPARRLL